MIELERYLTEQLAKLPKNHPERGELEAYLEQVHIANSRRQRAEVTETPIEVKRFTVQAREALTKEGHIIYPLTGQSIKDQMAAGREFWYVSNITSVRVLPSRTTEVAFNPDPKKFLLPKSNNQTLDQQLAMVADYSNKLQRNFKTQEVEAIIGQAPDYTSLIFAHLDATSKRLFGADYGYNYARTQTPSVESVVALVGDFGDVNGPGVSDWYRGGGDGNVFAVPLVVPK